MKLFELRTSDSKEWVNLHWKDSVMDMYYEIDNVPKIFASEAMTEMYEGIPKCAADDTGHPCEWVEVQIIEAKPMLNPPFRKNGIVDSAWDLGFRAAMKYFEIEQS